MPRHEHFEELAAIAALGELTPSQARELNLHLADCSQCKKIYEEYGELHFAIRPSLDAETEALIESRRPALRAAVLEHLVAQQPQRDAHAPYAKSRSAAIRWASLRTVWSGFAVVAVVGLAFWLGARYERHERYAANRSEQIQLAAPAQIAQSGRMPSTVETQSGPGKRSVELQYSQLTSELRAEKQHNARLAAALGLRDRELAESDRQRLLLQQRFEAETEEVRHTQLLLDAKTEQLKQMEAAKANDADTLVALQYQVQDVTEKLNQQKQSLERERQFLASGREIRDIIGARNLHILDVYDIDSEGNTRKSFARAFYTEGKSLIFYAYDLPARQTEEGKYVYTAWGQNNGNKNRVRNLGILLNDDKGQRRWVLNFSDPKVLAEIDSVFITLERVGKDGDAPSGKRMLTAYLAGRVNHP